MPGTLVTVDEAGLALGVSRSTVWRLIKRGELPSVRRGGQRPLGFDKDWSLCDAISFAVLKGRRITRVFTFDHHFR